MPVPIIDLFAGPGGLGEGFSTLVDQNNERIFKIALSIEKNRYAHQTLTLRSFFRQFPLGAVPEDYYSFIKGKISIDQLYKKWPIQAALAQEEAWCATLGVPDEEDTNGATDEEVDEKIIASLNGQTEWLLIGGPPCQAYSLVGRSRRQEKILDEARDKRVGLYKEYLRILAFHNPAVFVMENVKGILSAQTEQSGVFGKILTDLSDPVAAYLSENNECQANLICPGYKIFSLVSEPKDYDIFGNPTFDPRDFIIKSEEYGVPQKRHRVILLGIRNGIDQRPTVLSKSKLINLRSIIGNLPPVRSGISRTFTGSTEVFEEDKIKKKRHYQRQMDSFGIWEDLIEGFRHSINNSYRDTPDHQDQKPVYPKDPGMEFIETENFDLDYEHPLLNWFYDVRIKGIIHHVSRTHLTQDLKRYLFAALYTGKYGRFPKLNDYKLFDEELLPDHDNADSGKFVDRFRVQLPDIPATTVTSHISKDGHYFIHYDPVQCRSLTVREAARIQTFPDNYFFCGGRTQKFHQVGNAVPPYLAYQIAGIVKVVFTAILAENNI